MLSFLKKNLFRIIKISFIVAMFDLNQTTFLDSNLDENLDENLDKKESWYTWICSHKYEIIYVIFIGTVIGINIYIFNMDYKLYLENMKILAYNNTIDQLNLCQDALKSLSDPKLNKEIFNLVEGKLNKTISDENFNRIFKGICEGQYFKLDTLVKDQDNFQKIMKKILEELEKIKK